MAPRALEPIAHDPADRDLSDEAIGRDPAERDVADRDSAEGDVADRDSAEGDLAGRDSAEGDVAGRGAERGWLIVPCPRLSRARPVFSADGARVAREVGVGPARVLVSWARGSEVSAASGLPRAYRIETAASSRDGSDGQWRHELSVSDNAAPARAHEIEFDGQSWVRMTIDELSGDELSGGAPCRVERFDVHDASDGTDDSWLVLGDGLAESVFALDGDETATFAGLVHERYPGYFPVVIDEGRSGEAVAQTLARLPALLALHAHARHALLLYGDSSAADAQGCALLVRTLIDAGRVPVIVQLPDAALAAELEARYELVPGPDLRSLLAPAPAGPIVSALAASPRAQIHRLLADAMDALYVPH
jgi:hypothetical protein